MYASTTNLTLLLELGIVREDVQSKRVIPSVDEINSLVKIVDGNDGQNRCEYFTGRRVTVRTADPRQSPNLVHSLAHKRIVRTDVPDDRRSHVFRLAVGVSTKYNSSLGVIQQSLGSVKASMVRETSDIAGLGRAGWIKFQIP